MKQRDKAISCVTKRRINIKEKVRGLKFQNRLYLIGFSVLILVVLWALQFIFLGAFYHSMKLSETESLGNEIADSFNSVDFYATLNNYAFENNLRIVLLDDTRRIAVSFDGFASDSQGFYPTTPGREFPQEELRMVMQKFTETTADRITFFNSEKQRDISHAIFAARIKDQAGRLYYLYMSSPIPAIDSTVSALKTQYIIITIILLALSLAAAQLISSKLSKPIIRLTGSAEKLIRGELDSEAFEDGYTEINKLAAAMNYAASELRSLDNYRREFVANVSHDLKTPLTIIKLYGEMIKEMSDDDPIKRDQRCDHIIREADWLTNMVGELLELSKLEAGGYDFTQSEFNLSKCLDGVLESFSALAEKDSYTFICDISDDIRVSGSEIMLRRAIYNLLSNAINFTGEDKKVFINLKRTETGVRFEVADTGPGIPPELQAVIWDRYYKSKEAHRRAVVGSGIGLSIVKSVLTLHGASFGVISEQGRGSIFWFELRMTGQSLTCI